MDDDRRIASRKGARNSWKRMSNRRRTITNQLVRRRNPTPHEFPPGWTIKSERVCPTYLETNGETWINNVFDSPTLLSSPSIYPFFFIPRGHEHDSSIRTKRNGCCYTLLRIQFNLWWPLPFVIVIIRRIESERLWMDPWKIDNSDRNIANNYLLFI